MGTGAKTTMSRAPLYGPDQFSMYPAHTEFGLDLLNEWVGLFLNWSRPFQKLGYPSFGIGAAHSSSRARPLDYVHFPRPITNHLLTGWAFET